MSLFAAVSCTVPVQGAPVPAINISASLPFSPTIAERVNGRNDGSPFEPCVAYTANDLSPVGIDPASVADAAFSDSPNYRGCHWTSPSKGTYFSQILGDESSLETYKTKHAYRHWEVERSVAGRALAVAPDPPGGCIAAFMSVDAIVVTGANTTSAGTPSPDLKEECDKAVAFATLAASKAP